VSAGGNQIGAQSALLAASKQSEEGRIPHLNRQGISNRKKDAELLLVTDTLFNPSITEIGSASTTQFEEQKESFLCREKIVREQAQLRLMPRAEFCMNTNGRAGAVKIVSPLLAAIQLPLSFIANPDQSPYGVLAAFQVALALVEL